MKCVSCEDEELSPAAAFIRSSLLVGRILLLDMATLRYSANWRLCCEAPTSWRIFFEEDTRERECFRCFLLELRGYAECEAPTRLSPYSWEPCSE